MTITLHGDDVAVEQAAKQLYRLIDVLKVQDVTSEPTIEHELALIKIRATDSTRGEVLKLVELLEGPVSRRVRGVVIVEVTGTEADVDAFAALVRTYGIKELVRTGAVVMARGSSSIEEAIEAMTARMYYDNDADPSALAGQTVAIIGYGIARPCPRGEPRTSQGIDVVVGLAAGSKSRALPRPDSAWPTWPTRSARRRRHRPRPRHRTRRPVYDAEIAPNLPGGAAADVRPRVQHPLPADRPAGAWSTSG